MNVELLEIRDHMGRFPPFDALSDELLDEVASQVDVAYFRAGSAILEADREIHDLCYIRSGAVEIYRRNEALYNRLGEGDIFGHFNLLRNNRVRFPARAIEDTLIYYIPDSVFYQLCEQDDHFSEFVEVEKPRLQATVEAQHQGNELMATRVRKLVTRLPLLIEDYATVQDAAERMSEENVSAALIVTPSDDERLSIYTGADGRQWALDGILTDADLRSRVVAHGLAPETLVSEVDTGELITIQSGETVQEAMLCILRNNVQHLPILHRRRPIGLLHLSDIIRYETQSSLYLVASILNQTTLKGLVKLNRELEVAFLRMVRDGADSKMIGTALSAIGRSFARRILELAEEELGPPPVPYAFMVMGSMARDEQTVVTDQDNAMVLDDRYDPKLHGEYFHALAKRVTDGLHACGYHYCSGDIMATNDRWRQPLGVWRRYFTEWIDSPTPERLLHSNIFFDMDCVYGEEQLVEILQDLVVNKAPLSERFLAAMARNALNRTPPLGFFRTFVMEKNGNQNASINIKRRGTAPMVDLIRIHALACGSRARNSFERLDDIAKTQLLTPNAVEKIRYALEFMAMVRIQHHAYDLEAERAPDNDIEPENVSNSERLNLKDAFQVLSNAQSFLQFRYPKP